MGTVTGERLAGLIREHFGLSTTVLIMMAVLFTRLGNTDAEFAGVASIFELFGASRDDSVLIGVAFAWWLVLFGNHASVEKILPFACLVHLAYPISGLLAKPGRSKVAAGVTEPHMGLDISSVALVVGIVGTTIALWMPSYLQYSVVEKETKVPEYGRLRLDVFRSSIMAVVVPALIVVACAATLNVAGADVDPGRGRRGPRARAAGGTLCRDSDFDRSGQRLAIRCVDPAARHSLQCVRGPRPPSPW